MLEWKENWPKCRVNEVPIPSRVTRVLNDLENAVEVEMKIDGQRDFLKGKIAAIRNIRGMLFPDDD